MYICMCVCIYVYVCVDVINFNTTSGVQIWDVLGVRCQPSSPPSLSVIHTGSWHERWNAVLYVMRSAALRLWMLNRARADSEGWHRKLASVSAPFVSLLAPLSGTANLWLADKQLIDYGTAGRGLVYIVTLEDGLNSDSGLWLMYWIYLITGGMEDGLSTVSH